MYEHDRLMAQLFLAQAIFIAVNKCLNDCLDSIPVVSMSTFFYCCLASHVFLALAFHSPVYLAACLLNVLGQSLATVTGASYNDYPDIFYGSGCGYADDAGKHCWYLLHWILEDNARILACCVLPFSVRAVIFLTPRVWSWCFPAWSHRMVQEMEQQVESLKAETLAIKSRVKAENGWTDEGFERALKICGDNDEGAGARLGAFVEERAKRREEEEERKRETIVRAEELKARIRENVARMRESEAGLEG
jgi:hypothetical protein